MTVLTAVIFGLGPGAADRAHVGQRPGADRPARGRPARREARPPGAWSIGELALAQVLLVGAGLLLVSFVQATRIDLGYATTDRVVAEANLAPAYVRTVDADGRIDPARKIRFITDGPRHAARHAGVKRRRRVVHRAADRRAQSRHSHRRRSGAAARGSAERRLPDR